MRGHDNKTKDSAAWHNKAAIIALIPVLCLLADREANGHTLHKIVEYVIAHVNTTLHVELGISDGLAEPCVLALDPCCGTGTYLV